MHGLEAGGRPAAIEVDLGRLRRVAANLRRVAAELGRSDGVLLLGGQADPDLATALYRAAGDFGDQRRRLRCFLDGAARALESSVLAYESVEAELTAAAGGHGAGRAG